MQPTAQEFYLQFLFYRKRIAAVLDRLDEAHAEDLRENPDMFDRSAEGFSGRMHPNAALRALESDLAREDEDFLLHLAALLDCGAELQLGLAGFRDARELCGVAAEIVGELALGKPDATLLAHRITEAKAGLLYRRLSLALSRLSAEEY